MPRQARVVAVGVPHHVTQRGNNRQDIFLLDEDRRFYLQTLAAFSQRYRLTLLGYCLMTNHIHLVAVPQRPDSLARPWATPTNCTRSASIDATDEAARVAKPLLFLSFRA